MTILHVTDLHLHPRWFEWLIASAPRHDLLCLSGDLLDQRSPVPNSRQIERVVGWLKLLDRPVAICSGNHDLEWDSRHERWRPAHWLRQLAGPCVTLDGETVERDGWRIHSIACTTHPKGSAADIWLVHAPPAGLSVGRTSLGRDMGDADLGVAIERYAPRVVFSGHVHDPAAWFEIKNGVAYFNPGSVTTGRFPNHILFEADRHTARRVTDSATGARCEIATWSRRVSESAVGLVHA